jgi:hypothetical protein
MLKNRWFKLGVILAGVALGGLMLVGFLDVMFGIGFDGSE